MQVKKNGDRTMASGGEHSEDQEISHVWDAGKSFITDLWRSDAVYTKLVWYN